MSKSRKKPNGQDGGKKKPQVGFQLEPEAFAALQAHTLTKHGVTFSPNDAAREIVVQFLIAHDFLKQSGSQGQE